MFSAVPSSVVAQDQKESSSFADIVKGVVFDPTTYVPAAISYDATMRDWNSSQTLFQHGYVEHNLRFTISGLPNDVPVGYGEGNYRIRMDALLNVEMSLVNNFSSRFIERALMERYPEHRKRIRTLGWIERTAFASYMSYYLSQAHYRQWRANEQLARQSGY